MGKLQTGALINWCGGQGVCTHVCARAFVFLGGGLQVQARLLEASREVFDVEISSPGGI